MPEFSRAAAMKPGANDGRAPMGVLPVKQDNAANGQDNTDGSDNNLSWNCGWEGDARAPAEVLALRRQQVKNFFCLLMLSNGTPMFCAGDEFLNTQGGNNNPYNQDNEITWLDWSLLKKSRDVFRFFQHMIAFRKSRPWTDAAIGTARTGWSISVQSRALWPTVCTARPTCT